MQNQQVQKRFDDLQETMKLMMQNQNKANDTPDKAVANFTAPGHKISRNLAVEYRFYARLNLLKSEIGDNSDGQVKEAWMM